MTPCFNLTEESWIRVMTAEGRVETVTLNEALTHAHTCRGLAGETPTQDVAMLRFLLAVLYAALFKEPFDAPDDALDAWFALWEAGRFPAERIADYLTQWRERFWLFHDQRPFMQVASGRDGITMANAAELAELDKSGKPAARGVQRASKLNGAITESGNKGNLFNIATGEDKYSLSLPEAARWLIHVVGYDDGGIKPYYPKNTAMNRTDDLAKCSVSWLGSISSIHAEGGTLFETLMLNLVLLRDGELSEDALWSRQRPTWEYDTPHVVEMMGIALPDNPAELITCLSRRILLILRDDRVLGFVRYVGEAFPREAASTEQWTLWTLPKAKKGAAPLPFPRTSRLPAQMWREMGALLAGQEGEDFSPGVVRWVRLLGQLEDSPISDALCRFHYVKAQYDVAQSSNMTEVLNDSLTFSVSLLTEAGHAWVALLQAELSLYGRAAWQIGLLAEQLMSAEGGKVYEGKEKRTSSAIAQREAAQEWFFHELDHPFRLWLQDLRAGDDSLTRQARIQNLRGIAKSLALRCGQEMVSRVSPTAYSKRKKGEGEDHPTAPEAWLVYRRAINKLMPLETEQKEAGGVKA
ncbi:MAG: type I-E CRISPR-associated protein Cse1/CasA [bacterium]